MASLLPLLLVGGGVYVYTKTRKKKRRKPAKKKIEEKAEEKVEEPTWIDKGNYRYLSDCTKFELGGFDMEEISRGILAGGEPPPELAEAARRFVVENLFPEYENQVKKHGTRPASMISFMFDTAEALMPGCKIVPGKSPTGVALMLAMIAGGMPAFFDSRRYMTYDEIVQKFLTEMAQRRDELEGYEMPDGTDLTDLIAQWEEPEPLPPDEGDMVAASLGRRQSWFEKRFVIPNL